MHMLLSENCRVSRVVNGTAAGTTVVNGTSVDMAGWDGVLFVALIGALTATQVTRLKAQQSDDNGSADAFADLASSATPAMADGDSNEVVLLDVFRPSERYVRPVVVRGTANAVIDGVFAIQYRGRTLPVTQDSSTVQSLVKLVSPDEGTA